MRVLAISGDRSKRGVLYPDTPAFKRQEAYAKQFGGLDVIVFSRRSDGASEYIDDHLHIVPTGSTSRWRYTIDALRLAKKFPTPDVVTVQDPFETGFTGWLIARRVGAPLHVQVHTDFLSPEYARLSFGNRIRVLIAGFVLRRATRVRVVSKRVKESIEKNLCLTSPLAILPIFVNPRDVPGAVPAGHRITFIPGSPKFLVVSRLEPEKNVALAIQAFAEAGPASSALVIVGEGSERKKLEQLAERLGVKDRVHFEGEQDAVEYYGGADLVFYPSKYDGFGMVIIEALYAGKPVLATNVGIAVEAGAIVKDMPFADALTDWLKNGPKEGRLKYDISADFSEYVRHYCDDIAACIEGKKPQ